MDNVGKKKKIYSKGGAASVTSCIYYKLLNFKK
jgi:hypothetical protein